MATNRLLSISDFETFFLDGFAGRLVSHQVVTKTFNNITGEETLSYGAGSNIKGFFIRTGQRWDYQKAGFMERGDAIVLTLVADNVQKDDLIVVESNKFRVHERFDVPGVFNTDGTALEYPYTYCNLRLVDDE